MTSYTRVGAVTGANKGIGLAIVRQLALQYPKSPYNNGPLLIYLTARNEDRGTAALKDVNSDVSLKKAKALRADGGLSDVKFMPLDIDSRDSIQSFATQIKQSHPDGIDFLINNAGIAMQGFDVNVVKTTLHCNYYGTLAACQLLLPHIKDGGRLVNVASVAGRLSSKYSPENRSRFHNAKSTDEVTKLMEDFTSAVETNTYQGNWPGAAYATSKAGVIAMTNVIARENAKTGTKTLINSVCPGYVATDMTRMGGSRTPDKGAETPVTLAIGDIKGANGEFWQNEKAIRWDHS